MVYLRAKDPSCGTLAPLLALTKGDAAQLCGGVAEASGGSGGGSSSEPVSEARTAVTRAAQGTHRRGDGASAGSGSSSDSDGCGDDWQLASGLPAGAGAVGAGDGLSLASGSELNDAAATGKLAGGPNDDDLTVDSA